VECKQFPQKKLIVGEGKGTCINTVLSLLFPALGRVLGPSWEALPFGNVFNIISRYFRCRYGPSVPLARLFHHQSPPLFLPFYCSVGSSLPESMPHFLPTTQRPCPVIREENDVPSCCNHEHKSLTIKEVQHMCKKQGCGGFGQE
jgi:hypothetical protein